MHMENFLTGKMLKLFNPKSKIPLGHPSRKITQKQKDLTLDQESLVYY